VEDIAMTSSLIRASGVLLLATMLTTLPALAQSTTATTPAATPVAATDVATPTGVGLTTPFPELTLPIGQKATIPLTLRNDGLPPQRAAVTVAGLPDGWTADLTGAGKPVSAAIVGPGESVDLNLTLTPPANAAAGEVAANVTATYGTQSASLPLAITLATPEPGSIALKPQLPALRGSPTSSFQFRIDVTNNSPADALFNLGTQLPAGFTATFKHGFDTAEITGVPIAAGKTETVSLEVKPGPDTPAGDYPIKFAVLAGDLSAAADLGVQITGTPALALAGPEQRLSGDTVAGQPTTLNFTVASTGSTPAQDLKLSATPPSGWKVDFSPAEIPALDPNATQDVAVTITPSEKAIAGDYMVPIRVAADGASNSVSFRATVNTSTQWGIVGLIVIAAALLVLVVAVMRYGRR
jgi:uncharacterized membrane protein